MRTRHLLTAASAVVLLALTGCSSSDPKPDTAACKTAMAKQLDQAIADGDQAKESDRPAACDEVDTKTLERITGELTADKVGEVVDDAFTDTAGQPSAECRAWIEDELLSSEDIDAANGMDVCGGLTGEQLDQAIEDVTNDLTNEGATPAP
ncbi:MULTISPECIES: hypothetical protein [Streptomyces]|uniref:hypothetical protein n=1 Tax=Streptomyces TaxID=1883 RepID=UPI002068BCBE|nr:MULTISPECIES: hypothetical protein [Streptomyces]UPT41785.1 hypothetical protein MWG59_10290 [Streptomyces sp. WAC00303]WIY76017.1 hypothetical protein QPM16_10150 [Streptomyces anulatus]